MKRLFLAILSLIVAILAHCEITPVDSVFKRSHYGAVVNAGFVGGNSDVFKVGQNVMLGGFYNYAFSRNRKWFVESGVSLGFSHSNFNHDILMGADIGSFSRLKVRIPLYIGLRGRVRNMAVKNVKLFAGYVVETAVAGWGDVSTRLYDKSFNPYGKDGYFNRTNIKADLGLALETKCYVFGFITEIGCSPNLFKKEKNPYGYRYVEGGFLFTFGYQF